MAVSHYSSIVMLILLALFAVIHSGGASLRRRAETRMGEGLATAVRRCEHPSAVVVIGWFLAHRYDGIRLWNLQGSRNDPLVWIGTAISFCFFIRPPTTCWKFRPS